jgi:hypothetical protein
MAPDRWPSGIQPMASKPEPRMARTTYQLVAVPVPPPTRGSRFRMGVATG